MIAAQQLELGRLRRSLELLAQRQAEFADPVNNSV
ncbi:hypothetical protein ULG90_25350 [Halopseudomonas pachastrellae]|nr:hypothetical protein ULG90_25350 [Halopseudomonas pachastrellae]